VNFIAMVSELPCIVIQSFLKIPIFFCGCSLDNASFAPFIREIQAQDSSESPQRYQEVQEDVSSFAEGGHLSL
jgi:hypothetical protein